MNRRTFLSAIAAATLAGSFRLARAQTIQSLKDAYSKDFLIGSALGGRLPNSYNAKELALITSQFNAATPEVCMKPRPLHPKEGTWHFDEADAYVDFCQHNNIVAFGHTLMWHEDCPDWFFEDGKKPAPRKLVLERLQNHIQTILLRYKGRIRGWDVVNEAISDSPKDYFRKTKWLETIGEDHVLHAFRFAHEADPAMQLQYNDYNIEREPKRSKTVKLLKDLKAKGIPLTAVGIQGHWQLDNVPFADLDKAITEFSALGLKVMISELDMDVLPRTPKPPSTSAHPAPQSLPASEIPDILKRQADQYAKLFTIFHKHRDVITRVAFWGIDDAHTWLNNWPTRGRHNHPLLFDRNGAPKPAFDAVIKIPQ
jgi:endo-1,4-beta-xylanase